MATYYIDFEGGNDANAGTSFATRWKTISLGATGARIAPGDEIRIMASPDPTSIGDATWTGGGRPNPINISSSTNATPIVVTTSSAHGLVPGDYVMVTSHTTNTNANGVWKVGTTPTSTTFQILQMNGSNTTGNGTGGATGNITKINNCIVKTASPLVQNIALCGGQGQKPTWTAAPNVTCSQNTGTWKEGYSSANIAIAAGFVTGEAAYYTLPSTLDLSSYQQVSFWVQQTSGTVGLAGDVYLALCTDTTGGVVTHQCPIPALGATGAWVPVTVNFGTNLNSAIKSVSLFVVTDRGAQTFLIDNIIACKASSSDDSLNIQSLISKSDGTGDEAWYPIQSINYDAIMLANLNSYASNNTGIKGYNGTSETVTTYKRETIEVAVASSTTSPVSVINDSGTSGNQITFSGGWNRTDMSTQTGRTWLDGQNGLGYGLSSVSRSYITIDKLDFCRYYVGYNLVTAGYGNVLTSLYGNSCSSSVLGIGACVAGMDVGDVWANNSNVGVTLNTAIGISINNVKSADNSVGDGVSITSASSCYIGTVKAGNCSTSVNNCGLRFGNSLNCVVGSIDSTNCTFGPAVIGTNANNCFVNGGSTSGNLYGVRLLSSVNTLYLNNVTIGDTTEVVYTSELAGNVYANRLDDTDGNNWVFAYAGNVNQQTSVVDSPATTAWKMNPTTVNATASNPIRLKLGTVVCAANSLVTVTARMRRSNTGLTMRLCCPGGQISGVSSDVTSDMTAAANTWETVTITFTPTKPGGVDIYAYAFGGTTFSGYVCNLTASQA